MEKFTKQQEDLMIRFGFSKIPFDDEDKIEDNNYYWSLKIDYHPFLSNLEIIIERDLSRKLSSIYVWTDSRSEQIGNEKSDGTIIIYKDNNFDFDLSFMRIFTEFTMAFRSRNIIRHVFIVRRRQKRVISKLEYFAAHAPSVPEWFEPSLRPEPKHPGYYNFVFGHNSGHKHSKFYCDHWNDQADIWELEEGETVPEDLQAEMDDLSKRIDDFIIDQQKWKTEYQYTRLVQWRKQYALHMLEELSK